MVSKRAPRIDLRRPAVMINSDGVECNVIILNVSSSKNQAGSLGMSANWRADRCRVEHREEFPAQIRWVLGNEAGGSFVGAADAHDCAEQGESEMATDKSDRAAERRSETDRRENERRLGDERQRDERSTDRRNEERRKGERRDQ